MRVCTRRSCQRRSAGEPRATRCCARQASCRRPCASQPAACRGGTAGALQRREEARTFGRLPRACKRAPGRRARCCRSRRVRMDVRAAAAAAERDARPPIQPRQCSVRHQRYCEPTSPTSPTSPTLWRSTTGGRVSLSASARASAGAPTVSHTTSPPGSHSVMGRSTSGHGRCTEAARESGACHGRCRGYTHGSRACQCRPRRFTAYPVVVLLQGPFADTRTPFRGQPCHPERLDRNGMRHGWRGARAKVAAVPQLSAAD